MSNICECSVGAGGRVDFERDACVLNAPFMVVLSPFDLISLDMDFSSFIGEPCTLPPLADLNPFDVLASVTGVPVDPLLLNFGFLCA